MIVVGYILVGVLVVAMLSMLLELAFKSKPKKSKLARLSIHDALTAVRYEQQRTRTKLDHARFAREERGLSNVVPLHKARRV